MKNTKTMCVSFSDPGTVPKLVCIIWNNNNEYGPFHSLIGTQGESQEPKESLSRDYPHTLELRVCII